ncbi:MAG: DUF2017 domain-containing protein [Candidatus Nanopelagicales bacterium]
MKLDLADNEKYLLADLIEQLLELVAADRPPEQADPLAAIVGISAPADRPSDPALARLLPDGYEDEEAAAEFRRFTQGDLRAEKAANARAVRESLGAPGPITISPSLAQSWLRTLNDLRLVLGVRLGITDDDPGFLMAAEEPLRSMYLVYDWLTFHQDQLIEALS